MTAAFPGLDRNAFIAASAGTGKTQTLTGIYLGFALGLGPERSAISVERIVATTFSRAAAAEIHERVEDRLVVLASAASATDPLAALAEQQGIGQRELGARARVCLDELPHASIDTLHGLALRLLRRYALELGLPPGLVVLDQDEAFEDAERVIDEVLTEALAGPLSGAAAHLLDACSGLERARNQIAMLLSRLDEEGMDPELLDVGDHVAEARVALAELATLAEQVTRSDPSELTAPMQNVLRALSGHDRQALRSALAEVAGVRVSAKLKAAGFWGPYSAFIEGLPGSESKLRRSESWLEFVSRAAELDADARATAMLLGAIRRELSRQRQQRGALGFGDVLRLARDALRDHPDLARRARATIDVLLVDEFQDTSRVQRDLLLLLRERDRETGLRSPGMLPGASEIREHGLVVVGDRKQSIYAFRGADVAVFARVAAELAGQAALAGLDLRGVSPNPKPVAEFHTLSTNFRSQPAIIDSINAIARVDFAADPTQPFEVRYTDAEALVPSPESLTRGGGRVLIVEPDTIATATSGAETSSAERALRTASVSAGLVLRLVREGAALKDIAILARRRATLPLLELALERANVPFVVAGRALYRTPEIRDMFAVLRLAQDPRDRHALAVIMRSPLGGLADRTLAELSSPGRGLEFATDWDVTRVSELEERPRVVLLAERLLELCTVLPRLAPRAAIDAVVRRFSLEALYASLPRGRIRLGNIERLLEIAAGQPGSLGVFVRWLDRQIALDIDEAEAAVFSEEDAALRLLTIHASKGLAFPIVILVDTAHAERPQAVGIGLLRAEQGATLVLRHLGERGLIRTPLLVRANEDDLARARAERQRLSYVALTRARHTLALVLPGGKYLDDTLAAAVLRARPVLDGIAGVECVRAEQLLNETTLPDPEQSKSPSAPPTLPERPRVELATIGVTALADFAICARRFQLIQIHGIGEPEAPAEHATILSEDALSFGSAAHRVLENWPLLRFGEDTPQVEVLTALVREGLPAEGEPTVRTARGIAAFLSGPYARGLRGSGFRVHRELSLAVPLTAAVPAADTEPRATVLLKATLDLVVERADGSVDVIDYKRSAGGDAERYAFQLAAYREAVEAHFGVSRVRTGLVQLLAEAPQPEWQEPPRFQIQTLATQLVQARLEDAWPSIAEPLCRRARCGFIRACHGRNTDFGAGPKTALPAREL